MEAGFSQVRFFISLLVSESQTGRDSRLLYLGVPLSLVLGGPLSGLLLEIHTKGGLQGWQWMFLVEGFLAVAMGLMAFRFLDNRPANAGWLPADEKQALIAALEKEEQERRTSGPSSLLRMLRDPRVLRFVLIYTLIQMSIYGAIFYLPAEVSALMQKPAGLEVGLVTAIRGSAPRLPPTG